MIRIIIADSDLDSHESIDDLIEINFRDAVIEHAVTKKSFLKKIMSAVEPYNLILYNFDLDKREDESIVSLLRTQFPELLGRLVCINPDNDLDQLLFGEFPMLQRPFSLDHFGEVVKKACVY